MSDHDPLDDLRDEMASEWSIEAAEITGRLAGAEHAILELVERRQELFRLLRTAGEPDRVPDPAERRAVCERVANAELPEPGNQDDQA